MQFDLLQKDLFTDELPVTREKNTQKKYSKPPEAEVFSDIEVLTKLPDSLLSALSHPCKAIFQDIELGSDLCVDDELSISHKSPDAFKTISEAAAMLDVPQHVLRFWESRFSQIKPIKSRGGRRYYRSEDIKILETIKHLLYKQGYTIKGAKKAFLHLKKSESGLAAISAEDVQSLSFEQMFAQLPSREALSQKQILKLAALRNELASLRDALKLHI